MKKTASIILFAVVGALGFYASQQFLFKQFKTQINILPPSTYIEGQTEFACDSVADAYLTKMVNENSVSISAGKGTDKLALRINSPGKYVSLLTQAAVGVGESEGAKHQILEETDEYVVAIAQVSLVAENYSLLFLNKKEKQGVWTKVGDAFWRSGQVMYLVCY